MIHRTKGIVLRTIKYGETSVVTSIFTEMFGIQSYIINGVRTSGKGAAKASYFQPASVLEMEVYHNELKNLQRIKEYKWSYLFKNIFNDVIRNAVAVYMVELLQKCLKQPEGNLSLFQFTEDAFMQLDICAEAVTANFPLYFSLQLIPFFGFSISDNYSEKKPILDLQEGCFTEEVSSHSYYLHGDEGAHVSLLLKAMQPDDLYDVKFNKTSRREMLSALQTFYALHIPDFGQMKTVPVLQEILG